MQNNNTLTSYEAYLNLVNNQEVYYFVFVSSAIGIPGNLISMLVFIRLMIKNPKINMGLLYTCQTAIDLIVLILTLLVFRGSTYLFGYLVLNLSDSYCRVFAFLRRFTLHLSSWMAVFIAFDRFTFVLYEHRRFKFMKNKLVLSALLFGVMTVLALVDVENFFSYLASSSKTAFNSCTSSNTIVLVSDIISVLFRTYIPLLLMTVFNCLMIYRILEKKRSSNIVRNDSIKRKEHHFTIAVISCDALFFLSKFPLSVFYIFYDVNLYSGAFKNDSILSAIYSLLLNVFVSISFLDQTLSFFMYLTFNNLFRKELFKMLLYCLPYCTVLNTEKSSAAINKSFSKRNDQSSLS